MAVIFGRQHLNDTAKLLVYNKHPPHLSSAATLPCKMECGRTLHDHNKWTKWKKTNEPIS